MKQPARNDYLVVFVTRREEGIVGLASTPALGRRMVHDFIVEHFPIYDVDRFDIRMWVNLPNGEFGGFWNHISSIPVTKSMKLHRPRERRHDQGGEDDGTSA